MLAGDSCMFCLLPGSSDGDDVDDDDDGDDDMCSYSQAFEAYDFWSTFNLTDCVSELRLVTLNVTFFFFCYFFVLLIKIVSSNKIMFSNFIFQGARQVHSVSFSTPEHK